MLKSHVDEMIFDLADSIMKANQYDIMMSMPNCETCGKECEYRVRPGERVRINCPLWEGKNG